MSPRHNVSLEGTNSNKKDTDTNLSLSIIDNDSTSTISHRQLFSVIETSNLSFQPVVDFFYSNATHKYKDNHDDSSDENDHLGSEINTSNPDGRVIPTSKKRREAVCNLVKSAKFNKSHAKKLFSRLTPMLKKISEEESYLMYKSDDEEEDDGCENDNKDETSRKSIRFLQICASLVESYLVGILSKQQSKNHSLTIEVIYEAFEVAEMLHGLLFPLQSCGTLGVQTQSIIFAMCERWWHGNFEGREHMVTQLIPLLLLRSLEENAQKNDIKRLCSLREAIDLLDFDDSSIETLKVQLLRTVYNPIFLQCVEGRKFIAHLFQVDPGFVVDLHKTVKVHLPYAKKSILSAYAEIYYNSWKSALKNEEILTAMEENALQDLMYHGIHVANPSVAKNIRAVLDKFYINKKNPDVETTLHRLYTPLLWRALSSSNARVRIQASTVLADTFPLRNPKGTCERTETVVEKSVTALITLMEDVIASVRVAGSIATAKILSTFWVAIPTKDIRHLLNHIITQQMSDVTSAPVRVAAIDAVTTILGEEMTHAVLRPLLPSVGNMIHDKSEKVRLAVIRLLLVVKKMRGMKYYHVVPAKHLLARLEDEGRGCNNATGPVAKGLTELLSNSFFPVGSRKNTADIIHRIFCLLQDNPGASVIFYRNASTQLSVNSIGKLINALLKCLCFLIVKEKKSKNENVANTSLSQFLEKDGIVRSQGSHMEVIKGSNTAIMATIAESISILWDSIEISLQSADNQSTQNMLFDAFSSDVLIDILNFIGTKFDNEFYETSKFNDCFRTFNAVLNCASKIKLEGIQFLRTHIICEMTKLSDTIPRKQHSLNLSIYASQLCIWGMTNEIAHCLASSISNYFMGDSSEKIVAIRNNSDRARKRKGYVESLPNKKIFGNIDIDVCFTILGHILKGAYPAFISARTSIIKSDDAYDAIMKALQNAQKTLVQILRSGPGLQPDINCIQIKNIGVSIECYGRLLLHKQALNVDVPIRICDKTISLLAWISDSIVPLLLNLIGENDSFRNLDISGITCVETPERSPLNTDGQIALKSTRSSVQSIFLRLSDTTMPDERCFNVYQGQSKFDKSLSAGVFAIRSVLLVLSELFSICGLSDVSLSSHVLKWCQVLNCTSSTIHKMLLPVMLRIALLCFINEKDTTLFREILISIEDAAMEPDVEEVISFFFSGLSSLLDDKSFKVVIDVIVQKALMSFHKNDLRGEKAEFHSSVLDKIAPCIKTILIALLSESQGSLMLAEYLTDETNTISARKDFTEGLAFHASKMGTLNKIFKQWVRDYAKNEERDIDTSSVVDKNIVPERVFKDLSSSSA